MIRHLQRLFQYDAWANRETLHSLKGGQAPEQCLRWMAHIVGAEYLWLARLRRESAPLEVWPRLELEQCEEHLLKLSRSWPNYLESQADSLAERIPYINSKGEAWTSTAEEILTHVTIHSAYHRGQIATGVRGAGRVPAYTDYIHAVRSGYVR